MRTSCGCLGRQGVFEGRVFFSNCRENAIFIARLDFVWVFGCVSEGTFLFPFHAQGAAPPGLVGQRGPREKKNSALFFLFLLENYL